MMQWLLQMPWSRKEGLSECYRISGTNVTWSDVNCSGWRLPTEAEWEYLARGGGEHKYSGSNSIGDVAWYRDNSGRETHPVGQKQANGFGLYDMTGNVWEWTWDWYGDYSSGSVTDPRGPSSSSSGCAVGVAGSAMRVTLEPRAASTTTPPTATSASLAFVFSGAAFMIPIGLPWTPLDSLVQKASSSVDSDSNRLQPAASARAEGD